MGGEPAFPTPEGAAGDGQDNPLAAVVGISPAELIDLVALLRDRGQSVATAESLTAGLACAVLTSVPGASAVVRGGFVVYATELKWGLAGVRPGLLAEHGAVHPEVAAELAVGARDRCAADWGIGLTGVAGPDWQDGVAPGVVHIGLAGPDEVDVTPPVVRTIAVAGDRHQVRAAAVRSVVKLLYERLGRA